MKKVLIFIVVIIFLAFLTGIMNDNEKTKEPQVNLLSYEIITEEDISYAGCKRITVSITMPDDSQQPDIDNTLNSITNTYVKEWDDVTVWAWKESEKEDIGKLPYTLGIKEYSKCN